MNQKPLETFHFVLIRKHVMNNSLDLISVELQRFYPVLVDTFSEIICTDEMKLNVFNMNIKLWKICFWFKKLAKPSVP